MAGKGLYARIEIGLPTHPKFKRLRRALGGRPDYEVTGILAQLWLTALTHAQDGVIPEPRPEWAADATGWEGDAESLWDALVVSGWVSENGELKDFGEYYSNLWRVRAERESARDRKRQERKRAVSQDVTPCHAPSRNVRSIEGEGEGEGEGKGEGSTRSSTSAPKPAKPTPGGPPEYHLDPAELVQAWNELGPPFKRVPLTMSPAGSQSLQDRLQDAAWCRVARDAVVALRDAGLAAGGGESGWVASFAWFIGKAENAQNILSGKYDMGEGAKRNPFARRPGEPAKLYAERSAAHRRIREATAEQNANLVRDVMSAARKKGVTFSESEMKAFQAEFKEAGIR